MTAIVRPEETRQKSAFLINRNYRLLFVGQTISLLGDQISTYTLILWVVNVIAAGRSWAPLAMSALLVASIAPNLLVGPLAGVFVDRWDHRATMIWVDAVRAGLWFSLVAFTGVIPLPFFAHGSVPQLVQFIALCTITFMSNICSQFFSPASTVLLSQVVPEEKLPQAVGWNQTMRAFAVIVGPPLAAPLLFTLGIEWALLIDALSFICSLLTIWAIRLPPFVPARKPHSNLRSEFVEGIHFSVSNVTVRAIIITSFIATFGVGAFDALYVFFLADNLHAATALIGLGAAALGIGALTGAFAAGKIAHQVGLKRLLYLSLLGIGLLLVVVSRLVSFGPALVVFCFLGVLQAALRIASSPLLLKETPRHMLGRVVAILNPLSTLASLVSATVAGYLAGVLLVRLRWQLLGTIFGPVDTTFIAIGLLFLFSALYALCALPDRTTRHPERKG